MSEVVVDPGRFRSDFDAVQAGEAAPWAKKLRAGAYARFEALGFPKRKDEAWRNLNLAALERIPHRAGKPGIHLVHRPEGVQVEPLADVLVGDPSRLGTIAVDDEHPFLALNTALMHHGLRIRIPEGLEVADPIHVLFEGGDGTDPTAVHPRLLVEVGTGASATLVEEYAGTDGSRLWTNAVTEIAVAENASLRHHRIQRDAVTAFHVGVAAVRLERDASYRSTSIALGGGLARLDLRVALAGPGADCGLDGLFTPAGKQVVDHHTYIDHLAEHTTSRQLYKGILAGSSRGVFNGRIFIHEGAQKTVAEQSNQNLLLSERALVHTNPQLRIYADDVKCRHGATVGQVDRNKLFYLRTRGLDEAAAREILVRAFASEILARVGEQDLRERLERLLVERFFDA